MKFAVKAWSSGKARAGVLQLGSCPGPIETPSLLLSTRKGLPHFIPPDLLYSLPSPDSHLFHVSSLHFLEGLSPQTISKIGGLHQMLGLPEHGFVCIPRDSIQCLPECNSSNKFGASFETPCGRRLIKPVEYVELISSLRPNIWTTLADEVPTWVSEKRNKTSVDRTIRWLDECIALNPDILQEEKPRLITGLGLPEEILQGVAAGIDVFDSTYLCHLTLGGFALTFPLDGVEMNTSDNIGSDQTKINLRATVYRKDISPIVENCNCYTCKNHTKAYINHLLNVHEMLAQTLLEIHNTHHYIGFFCSVREAIKSGNFEQFRQKFVEGRCYHVAAEAAAACM
ncbi:hypothetical protein PRUPE_1G546900 [Prunus persica]|uniref:Queuine tRNA-ribosyltransferase accessory subunit 2 n=1 Tax=Prunus persica TaxID=3760 RepID=A0A251RHU1_PRUPE|nr:hypothetical protein PRUPE_1G546900 [Prunus persica]